MGASAPFWRYSAASYPDLEGRTAINALVGVKNRNPVGENDITAGVWSYVLFNPSISFFTLCLEHSNFKFEKCSLEMKWFTNPIKSVKCSKHESSLVFWSKIILGKFCTMMQLLFVSQNTIDIPARMIFIIEHLSSLMFWNSFW